MLAYFNYYYMKETYGILACNYSSFEIIALLQTHYYYQGFIP